MLVLRRPHAVDGTVKIQELSQNARPKVTLLRLIDGTVKIQKLSQNVAAMPAE